MGIGSLWMIAKQRCNGLEAFTIGTDVLPVFSFEEEAQMFLGLGHDTGGWQVKETTYGELVSLLYGPCRQVEHVALDPIPGITELVSLSRKVFVEALLTGGPVPPPAAETVEVAS